MAPHDRHQFLLRVQSPARYARSDAPRRLAASTARSRAGRDERESADPALVSTILDLDDDSHIVQPYVTLLERGAADLRVHAAEMLAINSRIRPHFVEALDRTGDPVDLAFDEWPVPSRILFLLETLNYVWMFERTDEDASDEEWGEAIAALGRLDPDPAVRDAAELALALRGSDAVPFGEAIEERSHPSEVIVSSGLPTVMRLKRAIVLADGFVGPDVVDEILEGAEGDPPRARTAWTGRWGHQPLVEEAMRSAAMGGSCWAVFLLGQLDRTRAAREVIELALADPRPSMRYVDALSGRPDAAADRLTWLAPLVERALFDADDGTVATLGHAIRRSLASESARMEIARTAAAALELEYRRAVHTFLDLVVGSPRDQSLSDR